MFGASYTEIVEYISNGGDVNIRDNRNSYQGTLLHWAYDEKSVKALIQAGADVNARDRAGCTPLHWRKSEGGVLALIKAGADVTAIDDNKDTILHRMNSDEEGNIRILIKAGVDVRALNNLREIPIYNRFVNKIYNEIVNTRKIVDFAKRNFKYFVFKRWISSKEGVEWLYHPKRGGKYIEKNMMYKLRNREEE